MLIQINKTCDFHAGFFVLPYTGSLEFPSIEIASRLRGIQLLFVDAANQQPEQERKLCNRSRQQQYG